MVQRGYFASISVLPVARDLDFSDFFAGTLVLPVQNARSIARLAPL